MLTPGENIPIVFKRAETKEIETKFQKQTYVLDLVFDKHTERYFKWPDDNYNKKRAMFDPIYNLACVMGVDLTELPALYDWSDAINEIAKMLNKKQNTRVYANVTQRPAKGTDRLFPCFGAVPCFSDKPDLAFKDQDLIYYKPVGDDDINIVNIEEFDL